MKTHTVIGAEMLEQLGIYQDEPLVKIAHQICRWHHERYDGKAIRMDLLEMKSRFPHR